MSYRYLKTARVVISVAFLVSISFLFLDFREIGARKIAEEVLYLQFVPSFLKFISEAALGAAGFLFVLGATLLFGRIYCSFVCPLGSLQDAFSRVAHIRRFRSAKKRYRYSAPHNVLRYGILALTVIFPAVGIGLPLNILDPFSNFGRILSDIARPVVLIINNATAYLAEAFGYPGVYHVQMPSVSIVSLGTAFLMLLVAGWLSARHGRLYCNSICPVGTLLGLISKYSLFRVRIVPSACRECGACERICKSGCIDIGKKSVDPTRCVGCYNCLSVCPDQAMRLSFAIPKDSEREVPPAGRRNFLTVFTALGLGFVASRAEAQQVKRIIQSRPTVIPEKRTSPISPPGSMGVEQFLSQCTACHLCVSTCPSRVLVPSFLDYGLNGIMMPQMSFLSGHCNFDCTVCSEVCPSGAIRPLDKEKKHSTQVGVAEFIRENCVVYTDNTNCGACSEHCPTKAVHMVPYVGGVDRRLVIPEVDATLCVGCGGCEHACPTRPYKAIYVNGNPVHKLARKPEEKPLEQPVDDIGDFPF
ncbi:4Fe-4S binding protein [Maridesulfovibrio sp.]|uniref:4Fe-4S binding protein n=1 Tax=Maridesulfovibrio sp. TaxID=2795000 RepID=UPI002A187989|nr:4Fe-4S binding protein [Maridesulfovibrio sp.]